MLVVASHRGTPSRDEIGRQRPDTTLTNGSDAHGWRRAGQRVNTQPALAKRGERGQVLNSGSSTHLYGMRLTATLCNGAVRGQPVDSHVIICHTSVTCERHSYVCIYTTLGM